MSDDLRPDPDAPWNALRDVPAPPLGAKARVMRRMQQQLDAPARRRVRWPVRLVAAAVLVAAVVAGRAWLVRHPGAPAPLASTPGAASRPDSAAPSPPRIASVPAVAVPATPPSRQIAVAAGQRVEVPLADGHVSLRGPLDAVVEEHRVVLRSGTMDTLGRVDVLGPRCEAHVDGTAQVSVTDSQLVVRVFAGSAEVVPADSSCRVLELSPPPPAPSHAQAGHAASAPPLARERPRSPLAEEVAAYRQALAIERVDPIAALGSWRAAQKGWPKGALAHEVDLHVIITLVRLGHAEEARHEARAFLARYPDSPRAADVRKLVEDAH